MRNHEGMVVEGDIDDIRTVRCYVSSNFHSNFWLILSNFERLVLGGGGGGRPDYLQKLKGTGGVRKDD